MDYKQNSAHRFYGKFSEEKNIRCAEKRTRGFSYIVKAYVFDILVFP
jgi:hypothetical protein